MLLYVTVRTRILPTNHYAVFRPPPLVWVTTHHTLATGHPHKSAQPDPTQPNSLQTSLQTHSNPPYSVPNWERTGFAPLSFSRVRGAWSRSWGAVDLHRLEPKEAVCGCTRTIHNNMHMHACMKRCEQVRRRGGFWSPCPYQTLRLRVHPPHQRMPLCNSVP